MTDSSLLTTTTQNAVPLLDTTLRPPISLPPPSPALPVNGLASAPEEDSAEEGAIKCICSNPDDDGNTVMCDKCETWQHIICYYADRDLLNDDDSHFCVDCQPRKIDAKAADERQKAAHTPLPQETAPSRRKPGPKTKKSRKSESLGPNGLTNGHGSPRNGVDTAPVKPRRAGHRSSASSSHIPLKIPTKRPSNGHAMSPIKSPHSPPIPSDPAKAFSPEFMQLYRADSGEDQMVASHFEDIDVTNLSGEWVRNPDALAKATNGKTRDDIFMRSSVPVAEMPSAPWVKHRKEDRSITAHGTSPIWIYLTADKDVAKDSFVGELIGKIGRMQTYTKDPVNRWEYLRHPLPFVFFHPQLPIVIDTREEGSTFRYLRRSCEPNLTMKTMLEEPHDYHFCFVATRDIKAGAELTIPWTLDEHVRRFFTQVNEADVDEEYVSSYARRVLAEFGGCACDGPSCVMAQWAGWAGVQHKPKRKKGQRALGSRSSSEALKQIDDDMDDEANGSSSSHSKPHSRDNTPSSLVDAKNILGEPISEREKRKIEALERSEQGRQPDRKKTKRKSADNRSGNQPPTPGFMKRSSMPERDFNSPSADAPSGLKSSPSPVQGHSLSAPPPPAIKPEYSEAGCQADLDCSSLSQSLPSPTRISSSRRPMSSLHRRVFRKSVPKTETPTPTPGPVPGPDLAKPRPSETGDSDLLEKAILKESPKLEKDDQGDVKMTDTTNTGPASVTAKIETKPIDIPAGTETDDTTQQTATVPEVAEKASGDMRPPPTPRAAANLKSPTTNDTISAPKSADDNSKTASKPSTADPPGKLPKIQVPSKLAPHLAHGADAAATSPSPAKKKINLSQYLARRNSSNVANVENDADNKDTLSAKGSEDMTRSLSPLREEAKENGDGDNAVETPKVENGDPMITT